MHRAAWRAATQSLSFDARFRVLDRAEAPFGLTLSVAPHWRFVDEASGVRTDHSEVQLLVDCELKPDRLIGADTGRRYCRTALGLVAAVLASIYFGVATPSEGGA